MKRLGFVNEKLWQNLTNWNFKNDFWLEILDRYDRWHRRWNFEDNNTTATIFIILKSYLTSFDPLHWIIICLIVHCPAYTQKSTIESITYKSWILNRRSDDLVFFFFYSRPNFSFWSKFINYCSFILVLNLC